MSQNPLRAKLNRQFFLKRSIPEHIVQNIIQYRPTVRRPISEWTLMIVIYFLKNHFDDITLTFTMKNNEFRVEIHTHPHHTTLSIINDDEEHKIFFTRRFPSLSRYPTTAALRLLFAILTDFRLNVDFSRYSELLLEYQEELKINIPKMKLYWSRIKKTPKNISSEEQSFFSYLHSIKQQQYIRQTVYTIDEYFDLFPHITLQQALYWQAQAHDFL